MARPSTYRKQFCEQARFLCEQFGATDDQLAKALGISDATLYTWKKEHAEFLEAISQGKVAFDSREIDTSCKALAMGFYYQEERFDSDSGMIVRLWKYCKPDIKAIALWKANRSGWRLPTPTSDRPAGSPALLEAEVRGNAEPPGYDAAEAELDSAAQDRLNELAREILETKYGTKIKHVDAVDVTEDLKDGVDPVDAGDGAASG